MNMHPKNWLRKLFEPNPVTLNFLVDSDALIEVQQFNSFLSLRAKEDILIAPKDYYSLPTGVRFWGDCLMLMARGGGMVDPGQFDLVLSNPVNVAVGSGYELWLNFWNPNDSVFAIESGSEVVAMYAAVYSSIVLEEVRP